MQGNAKRVRDAISTHAPYTEGDVNISSINLIAFLFQLTPPIQRATSPASLKLVSTSYFNSRPLYRGRRNCRCGKRLSWDISTHAPYTEGDPCDAHPCPRTPCISTHAPYTEGDMWSGI